MKCLRIKNGKGEFSVNGVDYSPIDEIKKDDLLSLVDIILDSNQSFEMDEYDEATVKNSAHRVIYSNLYDRFEELQTNKEQFVSEASNRYQEAYDKYKIKDENLTIEEV